MIRVVVILGLLALGVFFWHKSMNTRPHALKKEPLRIDFARRSPPGERGEMVCEIPCKKLAEIIGAAVWLAIAVSVAVAHAYGTGSLFYIVPSLFGFAYNAQLATRRIEVYEHAIVFHRILRRRVYYLADIDSLVTYNIVNSFFRGVGFGYRLMRDDAVLCEFSDSNYHGLDRLEEIFSEGHPAVLQVIKYTQPT